MRFLIAILVGFATYSTYASIAFDWHYYLRIWALTSPLWQALCLAMAVLNFRKKLVYIYLAPLLMDFGFFKYSISTNFLQKSNSQFSVLSWNTESLNYYENLKNNPLASKHALQWLISHRAEIKFFQEFIDLKRDTSFQTKRIFKAFGQDMAFLSEFDDSEDNHHGLAIATKGKIVRFGKINDLDNLLDKNALWADIALNSDTIRAICVHLQPMAFKDSELVFSNLKSVLGKYLAYSQMRTMQTQALYAFINKSPYPVVVGGDFNDPAHSHNHFLMSQNLNDSFEAGCGMGFSLKRKPYLIRIDRIYSSMEFIATKSAVVEQRSASDHFAIEAFFKKK